MEISQKKYDELYMKKLPKSYKGQAGKDKLLKILNLSLTHKLFEVAMIHGIAEKTIRTWLKDIYGDEYGTIINSPKHTYTQSQPERMKQKEDPGKYYARIKKEMVETQTNCEHRYWVMRCTPCGKILASDSTVSLDTNISDIMKVHSCIQNLTEQTI